jgi:FHA domain/Zinc-ribbon containing domain
VEELTSGAVVGPGSFRCRRCEYVLTLSSSGPLGVCPRCAGEQFARASLFSTESLGATRPGHTDDELAQTGNGPLPDPAAQLARARRDISRAGQYICYEEDRELRIVALTREWTRIGRSLAADIRFDDPTVSRRHALVVRHPDGVRMLDDRSLNGVFVNGARVEGSTLSDGDEIVVGRHRLTFIDVPPPGEDPAQPISSSRSSAHSSST